MHLFHLALGPITAALVLGGFVTFFVGRKFQATPLIAISMGMVGVGAALLMKIMKASNPHGFVFLPLVLLLGLYMMGRLGLPKPKRDPANVRPGADKSNTKPAV